MEREVPSATKKVAVRAVPALLALLVAMAVALSSVAPARAAHPAVMGARAMGMGGAFTAVVDDASAVYWNPAAIGLRSLTADASVASAGISGLARLQELAGKNAKELAEWEGGESGAVGVLIGGNVGSIGAAYIVSGEVAVSGKGADMEGYARIRTDIGVGAALDVARFGADNVGLRIGAVMRSISAEHTEMKFSPGAPEPETTKMTARGYALDAGVIARATDVVTVGAVIRNGVGDLTWTGGKPSATPSEMEFRAGVALKPPILDTVMAAEIGSGGEIRYGLETRLLFGGLALRAGRIHRDGHSWTTLGAGLTLGPVSLDVAGITPDFKEIDVALEASLRF